MKPARLISLIGIDGSGKSALLAEARACLPQERFRVFDWRTPPLPGKSGWLDIAALTPSLVHSLPPSCRASLIAGILTQHYETVLQPSLESGFVVLTDGYPYKLWAKELVFNRASPWLYQVLETLPPPDLVVYLAPPPEVAFLRKPMLSSYEYRQKPTREDFVSFQSEVASHLDRLLRGAPRVVRLPWEHSPQELMRDLLSARSEGQPLAEARHGA
jgi:thymidylate kinase